MKESYYIRSRRESGFKLEFEGLEAGDAVFLSNGEGDRILYGVVEKTTPKGVYLSDPFFKQVYLTWTQLTRIQED